MSAQPAAEFTAAAPRRIGGKCNYIVDDKVSSTTAGRRSRLFLS